MLEQLQITLTEKQTNFIKSKYLEIDGTDAPRTKVNVVRFLEDV